MTAIQSRYGQDVHKGKDDGKNGSERPEALPVGKIAGKRIADRNHAAQAIAPLLLFRQKFVSSQQYIFPMFANTC